MQGLQHIVRLTRPLNLVIVVITMIIVRYSVMSDIMAKASIGMKFALSALEFTMLILSVVTITAAGNIINDYFDQKVDRINKPDRVVVGKKVKRRVAIILHQALNISGFLVAAIVCLNTGYWWPILIPIAVITLLWLYSPIFKKRQLIGNIVVAFCTACVPFWAAVFEIHELQEEYGDLLVSQQEFFSYMWLWILALSIFAFIITLAREAVKDMEDMEGDRTGDYHTLPLMQGTKKTKQYVFALLILFLIGTGYGISRMHNIAEFGYFSGLILLPTLFTIWSLHRSKSQQDFRKCSGYLKLIIIGGLLLVVIVL